MAWVASRVGVAWVSVPLIAELELGGKGGRVLEGEGVGD